MLLKGRIKLHAAASVFFACSVNVRLPFDKRNRGEDTKSGNQGFGKTNTVPLIMSRKVHPAEAELTDGGRHPRPRAIGR